MHNVSSIQSKEKQSLETKAERGRDDVSRLKELGLVASPYPATIE